MAAYEKDRPGATMFQRIAAQGNSRRGTSSYAPAYSTDPARIFANPPQSFDASVARHDGPQAQGWAHLSRPVVSGPTAEEVSAAKISASLAQIERAGVFRKWVIGVMACASLGLVGLGAYWGVETMKRETLGVPLIAAPSQPARIPPEDPGGVEAEHMGLAVNEISAGREAAPVADQIILAPPPVELIADVSLLVTPEAQMPVDDKAVEIINTEQFEPIGPVMPEASEAVVAPAPPESTEALIESLLAEVLEGAPPPSDSAPQAMRTASIPASVAGVSVSLVPQPRPEMIRLVVAEQTSADLVADDAARAVLDIDPASLQAGDMVVQLGAFDTVEAARGEWDRLAAQFDGFFEGRGRVIMAATSGGQEFFRLRVAGFDGVDDARRFCTALLALGQACIPATIR
ncbi:SPOR domain-containing protein [Rhodobacteraceae bacterium XHP0102]|nr:SPOR domain-containing protein [Rhodobacteraceae bacterium XHP0102]